MKGYESIRDKLHDEQNRCESLDKAQLMKHAFALRTEVHRAREAKGLNPILLYVYAEPAFWPRTGESINPQLISAHQEEIEAFAKDVAGDEVKFLHCTYQNLLASWRWSESPDIRTHAETMLDCFSL